MSVMTQNSNHEPIEPGSDVTRGAGGPRIQPVLMGLVLAALIAAIVLVTFWVK